MPYGIGFWPPVPAIIRDSYLEVMMALSIPDLKMGAADLQNDGTFILLICFPI